MNKQIELKPCPFCGGEAEITVVKKGFKSIIECKTHYCGFTRHSFNNGDTDEHAAVRLATAWNSRANDKQTEGEWIDAAIEQIIRKKAEVNEYWQNDVKQYRASQGYLDIEHDVANFLQGYGEAIEDIIKILDGAKMKGGE